MLSAMTYYRYATRRDLLELGKASGRLVVAIATLNSARLDRVAADIEVVHARIAARKQAAQRR